MIRSLSIPNLRTLKLSTDDAGLAEFFEHVMQLLDERPFGALLIDFNMAKNQGGAFSYQEEVDSITFPKRDAHYDKITHTLVLSEEGILTFVHEASHFLHLVIDKGVWIAPANSGIKPIVYNEGNISDELRYACEFEAGYRAVCSAMMYDMKIIDKIVGDNLRNLLTYRTAEQYEWLHAANGIAAKASGALDNDSPFGSDEAVSPILEHMADDFTLNVCTRYMLDKRFSDIHDINAVNIELTPFEKLSLHFLAYQITKIL